MGTPASRARGLTLSPASNPRRSLIHDPLAEPHSQRDQPTQQPYAPSRRATNMNALLLDLALVPTATATAAGLTASGSSSSLIGASSGPAPLATAQTLYWRDAPLVTTLPATLTTRPNTHSRASMLSLPGQLHGEQTHSSAILRRGTVMSGHSRAGQAQEQQDGSDARSPPPVRRLATVGSVPAGPAAAPTVTHVPQPQSPCRAPSHLLHPRDISPSQSPALSRRRSPFLTARSVRTRSPLHPQSRSRSRSRSQSRSQRDDGGGGGGALAVGPAMADDDGERDRADAESEARAYLVRMRSLVQISNANNALNSPPGMNPNSNNNSSAGSHGNNARASVATVAYGHGVAKSNSPENPVQHHGVMLSVTPAPGTESDHVAAVSAAAAAAAEAGDGAREEEWWLGAVVLPQSRSLSRAPSQMHGGTPHSPTPGLDAGAAAGAASSPSPAPDVALLRSATHSPSPAAAHGHHGHGLHSRTHSRDVDNGGKATGRHSRNISEVSAVGHSRAHSRGHSRGGHHSRKPSRNRDLEAIQPASASSEPTALVDIQALVSANANALAPSHVDLVTTRVDGSKRADTSVAIINATMLPLPTVDAAAAKNAKAPSIAALGLNTQQGGQSGPGTNSGSGADEYGPVMMLTSSGGFLDGSDPFAQSPRSTPLTPEQQQQMQH